MFPVLLTLIRRRDRFINSENEISLQECKSFCKENGTTMVDADLVMNNSYYFSLHMKETCFKNQAECEEKLHIHLNISFDFRQAKWINSVSQSEFQDKFWLRTKRFSPSYPVMNELLGKYKSWILLLFFILVVKIGRYQTEPCYAAQSDVHALKDSYTLLLPSFPGQTVCKGENAFLINVSERLLKYREAIKYCGSKGLENLELETFNISAYNRFYEDQEAASMFWTGAKRYNESHFYYDDTIFKIRDEDLCKDFSSVYPFRSSVLMTLTNKINYAVSNR